MHILFYSKLTAGLRMRIQEMLETLVPAEGLEVYRSIRSLADTLRRLPHDSPILLLQVKDKEELFEFVSMGDLLDDVRIILLLPDRKDETIALAHRLRPRFLSYSTSDFSEVSEVLSKMIGDRNGKPWDQ